MQRMRLLFVMHAGIFYMNQYEVRALRVFSESKVPRVQLK